MLSSSLLRDHTTTNQTQPTPMLLMGIDGPEKKSKPSKNPFSEIKQVKPENNPPIVVCKPLERINGNVCCTNFRGRYTMFSNYLGDILPLYKLNVVVSRVAYKDFNQCKYRMTGGKPELKIVLTFQLDPQMLVAKLKSTRNFHTKGDQPFVKWQYMQFYREKSTQSQKVSLNGEHLCITNDFYETEAPLYLNDKHQAVNLKRITITSDFGTGTRWFPGCPLLGLVAHKDCYKQSSNKFNSKYPIKALHDQVRVQEEALLKTIKENRFSAAFYIDIVLPMLRHILKEKLQVINEAVVNGFSFFKELPKEDQCVPRAVLQKIVLFNYEPLSFIARVKCQMVRALFPQKYIELANHNGDFRTEQKVYFLAESTQFEDLSPKSDLFITMPKGVNDIINRKDNLLDRDCRDYQNFQREQKIFENKQVSICKTAGKSSWLEYSSPVKT